MSTLLLLTLSRIAGAHEVQPTVADISMETDRAAITLDWVIEAPVAGLDLEGVADTNDAAGADVYDALRALPPDAMVEAFDEAWPDIARQIRVFSGDTAIDLIVESVTVPEVGDAEIPRNSIVTLTAPLPPGGEGLVFGWEAALGPLVVRQIGVENGYAAFLENGRLSDPIPRVGGVDQSAGEAFVEYVGVGFEHIVPLGLDHVLFVLGLFFLASRLGPLLWQVTAFTAAHTVTLALGALGIVNLPGDIVEPLIAASIVYVGVENVLARGLTVWRPVIVFAFGLLHGLGFASVLQDFGLGSSHFVPKLIGFNIGVEIGQLAVIAAAFIALGWLFAKHGWYKRRVSAPISIGIAAIALFWVLERTGTVSSDGIWGPMAALTEGGMPVLWGAGVALAVMLVVTIAVFLTDSDVVRDWGGFLTSFVAFIAVIGSFAALDYWVMTGLVAAWVVALRTQSIGGLDEPKTVPA
ncbi:MAG: HupE/UreJ family protein [Paracoccaceae bacterium]|nr:HupE/UreJ family protein [Paracoccaceae bacterium]